MSGPLARKSLGLLVCAVVIACSLPAIGNSDPAENKPSFDYLYIESNEGGSSGGHTAVRFGGEIYHFQNEESLLVLKRERAYEFFYEYAMLSNRTIHASRVATSEATVASLLDRFRERHLAQEAQLEVADALQADRELLEKTYAHSQDTIHQPLWPRLQVPGLGYFEAPGETESHDRPDASFADRADLFADRDDVAKQATLALREFAAEIERAHGRDFLAERRRALIRKLMELAGDDPTSWRIATPTSPYAHPAFSRSYSSRLGDAAAGLAALEVLDRAPRLNGEAHHSPSEEYFALSSAEIEAFEAYREMLMKRLVGLAGSRRSDWGETLLIGMARLAVLSQSIASGRLHFLDTYPEDSKILARRTVDRHREVSSLMLTDNRRQLDATRTYFRDSRDTGELAWERLEEGSNRYFEISRAFREGTPMRLARGHLVPSYPAPFALPIGSLRSPEERARDLDQARHRERDYRRRVRRLHRYGLIGRNCVTALFETINDTFDDSVPVSKEQLGGHIDSQSALTFIPFVSEIEVNSRYTVVQREFIPSYRHRRIRSMKEREPSVRVAFRESNTFTANAYERSAEDSFFVFFTDKTPLLRPVFGVINLTASLGQSLLGIATAPLDRGDMLFRGLRGAFVSLPEIAFSNIRKGSNEWIATEFRNLEPISE